MHEKDTPKFPRGVTKGVPPKKVKSENQPKEVPPAGEKKNGGER